MLVIHSRYPSEPSDRPEVLALVVQDSEPADGEPLIPALADNDAVQDPIGESPPDSGGATVALRELFVEKSSRKPAVRALLKRHQPFDSRALNDELKEFALLIGCRHAIRKRIINLLCGAGA